MIEAVAVCATGYNQGGEASPVWGDGVAAGPVSAGGKIACGVVLAGLGIDLRRLGRVCGRRLVTGSCLSPRETTLTPSRSSAA